MKGKLPLGPLRASTRQPLLLECDVEDMAITSARLTAVAEPTSYAPGFEGASPADGADFASRLCARSSVHLALAFSMAVEDALGVEVPDDHAALRVALCEWARIASHLEVVSDVARALEDDLVYGRPRRYIHRIRSAFEDACGNAFAFGAVVPGGVALAAESGAADLLGALGGYGETLERDATFWARKLWLSRARLTRGRLDASSLQGEASAAALRASGSPMDLRAGEGSGPYAGLRYKPVTREGGTALDRALVLLGEIGASARLIRKVREAASGCVGRPAEASSRKGTGVGAVESPHGAVDCRVFLASDGKIIRARLTSDADLLADVAASAVEGALFEDAVPVLASLSLCPCCMALGGRDRGAGGDE